ncbi:MAG: beta-propeller fold lactonase family protein [Alphaproteobacteria bacterium]
MRRHALALALSAMLLAAAGSATAKDTGLIFVSSEKDNAVTVLDGKTYEVVATIGTAARPRHLQFSPDRSLIYVACGDGNAIDVIDVVTLALVDRMAGIDDPELFDLSGDGKTMYISLEDDAKLGILDLARHREEREETPSLDVAAPSQDDDDEEDDDKEAGDGDEEKVAGMTVIEVGEEPEGILAHPDGNVVYVTSEVANMVHVVDVAGSEIVHNVVVGNRPRRMALTADRKQLWVSNELSGSVTVLDTDGYGKVAEIDFLPRGMRREDVTPVGITMTADGRTAVVALGRANHVAFVDIASREIEAYVLVGKRAWNATLSRDNTRLYVANGLSDDITVIDMAKRKAITSIRVGRVPHTVLIDD